MGVSVREQLATTISGNIKVQNKLDKLYDSGFATKAVVQYAGSLNGDNVKTFIQGLENYATGKEEGVERIIPIPLGATLTPLNVPLADNQFIDTKKYNAL